MEISVAIGGPNFKTTNPLCNVEEMRLSVRELERRILEAKGMTNR
jgi:hypothetical protein